MWALLPPNRARLLAGTMLNGRCLGSRGCPTERWLGLLAGVWTGPGLARLSRTLENNECSRFLGLKYTESRRLRSDLQSHAVGLFVHDVIFCMSAHVLPCLLFDRRSHVICFCNVMHVLLHSRSSVKEKEDRCSTISFVGRLNDGIGAETYSVRALL